VTLEPESSAWRFRSVRPTWTNIRNGALLTGFLWGLFVLVLYVDPRTCYPKLCTLAEGHEWIQLTSETRIPVLDRRVDEDGDVWIEYVSTTETRELEAMCSEARHVSEVVATDARNHDARRVFLGMTFPDVVSSRHGEFNECCTTVYFSMVRSETGDWYVRQCF
jgi:hypothetical protein